MTRRHAASDGLVVMLDAAGRTIATLEDRVEGLTAQVHQLEQLNGQLEQQLAAATASSS